MSTSPGAEIPSHRACAHCRSQKVRCIPDENNPDLCQRCARSGRPCVFTPLQKRKQRKRTDTRVAELEREMRAMQSLLKKKQQLQQQLSQPDGSRTAGEASSPSTRPAGLWFTQNIPEAGPNPSGLESVPAAPAPSTRPPTRITADSTGSTQPAPTMWPHAIADRPVEAIADVIDRGILSMSLARQLYDTYRNDLFTHYPMVHVPASVSADEMRRTKPTLFLAVVAAAAAKDHYDLSVTLDQEVLHAYALRSLVQSEKSLELVQALLVSAAWYHPPQKFGQLKYYEYIHMAATMAIDIGIGTRPLAHPKRHNHHMQRPQKQLHPAEDMTNPDLSMAPRDVVDDVSNDTGNVESRRTLLACYLICASVSLSLRRPNMLRVTNYIKDCVEFMERTPDAIPSDRTLVAWVKLVMISEEISTAFAFDDPGSIASISDLRTQLMLKDFQARLTQWYENTPEADMPTSLTVMYYTVRLYTHEIALHVEHAPEDFTAPYQMGTIHPSNPTDIPTQVLAGAIAECISCSHELLNAFLATAPDKLRALPVFSFVRVSYACFVLAKLCLSASHPKSRISQVLDRSSLKVEPVLDRMILHVRNVVGPTKCRVPAIFLALLFKVRQWCLNPHLIGRTEHDRVTADAHRGTWRDWEDRMSVIQVPRVVEKSASSVTSSADDSPDYTGAGRKIRRAADESPSSSATADSPLPDGSNALPGRSDPKAADMSIARFGSDVRMGRAIETNLPNPPMPVVTEEQPMQIDQEMLQLWMDVQGGLSEGGLTGLDDWSLMPSDMAGFSTTDTPMNWQQTMNYNNGGMM